LVFYILVLNGEQVFVNVDFERLIPVSVHKKNSLSSLTQHCED